jgi:hypothetical protein
MRKVKELTPATERKLNMYTLAANAAVVAASSLPQMAHAHVIYTPANEYLKNGEYLVDINGDGVNDVSITIFTFRSTGYQQDWMWARGYNKSDGIAFVKSTPFGEYLLADAIAPGKEIGPQRNFLLRTRATMAYSEIDRRTSTHTVFRGRWFDVSRCLGVEFKINGEYHYGWLRIESMKVGVAKLTGYAYETEPNTALMCGFKQPNGLEITPVPQEKTQPQVHQVKPSSLGALALGAEAREYLQTTSGQK